MEACLSDYPFFNDSEYEETNFAGDDLFALLDSLDGVADFSPTTSLDQSTAAVKKEIEGGTKATEISPKNKKRKLSSAPLSEEGNPDGRILHITVERNRRKQMNDHLSVLRKLMPCFYVKRGDQASIIGGVVDYITELQQLLQSLEAKKQRKVYSEVLSTKFVSSPRIPPQLSPRKPPLSPRLNLPSPRTPQPGSPYMPRLPSLVPSPTSSSASSSADTANELSGSSKSAVADVQVNFSGANVLLKTVSSRIPSQTTKIVAVLEELCLEILNVSINVVDETMLNSFTIKVGIECQLSAEELAQKIQETFC